MIFSFLDQLLPFEPGQKLDIFYVITSLLAALALAIIVLWFYLEFGISIAIIVLLSTIFSQWLYIFARNLYWSLWAFYLPMIVLMFYLRKNKLLSSRQYLFMGMLVFTTIFIKCLLNGYEYMTTTLVMMTVPFIYYSVSN